MDEILNYKPVSQLIVDKTKIREPKFSVIDSHIHLGGRYRSEQYWERYNLDNVISDLKQAGVRHAINLELFSKMHWDFALERLKPYKEYISMCAPIDFTNINETNFKEITLNDMHYYKKCGACGFKVWKNLGLSIRNKFNEIIQLSDAALQFIWREAADMKLPVIIHVGDPPAFFEKVDLKNERYVELKNNKKWDYSNQLEVKYDSLLKQAEQLLEQNEKTVFVMAHLCSAPQDLKYVGGILKKHSNLYVDIAAVLSEIGRQPRQFKKFAAEYSDRILFGTDYFAGDSLPYIPYYRFLETLDEYFPYSSDGSYPQGMWNIYGCKLEDDILEKIYYKNAEKVFNLG